MKRYDVNGSVYTKTYDSSMTCGLNAGQFVYIKNL